MSEDLTMGDLARMSDEEWAALEEKMSETTKPEVLTLAASIRRFLITWRTLECKLKMSAEELSDISAILETIKGRITDAHNDI